MDFKHSPCLFELAQGSPKGRGYGSDDPRKLRPTFCAFIRPGILTSLSVFGILSSDAIYEEEPWIARRIRTTSHTTRQRIPAPAGNFSAQQSQRELGGTNTRSCCSGEAVVKAGLPPSQEAPSVCSVTPALVVPSSWPGKRHHLGKHCVARSFTTHLLSALPLSLRVTHRIRRPRF